MMQCPACSAPLVSGEARCVSCQALVSPPTNGNSALAPRLVTPRNLEGLGRASVPDATMPNSVAGPERANSPRSEDDAWRREVLDRVRKRRHLRSHSLPLFVDGQDMPPQVERPGNLPESLLSEKSAGEADERASLLEDVPLMESPADPFDALGGGLMGGGDDVVFDLPLRPAETDNAVPGQRARGVAPPSQSLVVRPRPAPITGPAGSRSLVADLPLVEPTQTEPAVEDVPSRVAPMSTSSGAASMNDRIQASFIDLGIWSAMSATAFYFASRIARTSIMGMGQAWQGLTLFGLVLAAAYILFFGGLSGATPGKIACGIRVRRYDGSPLGPLASLGRGFLGILGVVFLGIGIWPALLDKDRRTLHDRATDSRVTTV